MPKLCEFIGCGKQASYNNEFETAFKFCSLHKEPQMINLKAKKCRFPECNTIASFNNTYENVPIYCHTHKEPQMINVNFRACQSDQCKKRPFYNFKGEKRGIFCSTHKEDGMVDILSKKCHDCNNVAIFGERGSVTHCGTHKSPKMVKSPKKKCIIKSCTELALFGFHCDYPDSYKNYSTHCIYHILPGQIDVHIQECQKCHLKNVININKMCFECDSQNFNLKPNRKRKRTE
jgi:hypothetical protein